MPNMIKEKKSKPSTLTYGSQLQFAQAFAYYSKLNGSVVIAWCLQEQPPGSPASVGSNNWLNIQYTDSGPNSTYYEIGKLDPTAAARASVEWMKQNQPSIIAASKSGARAQAEAIVNSGWASSKYGGIDKFWGVVQTVARANIPGAPAVNPNGEPEEDVTGKSATGGLENVGLGETLGKSLPGEGSLLGPLTPLIELLAPGIPSANSVSYALGILTLEIVKDVSVGLVDLLIAPIWHQNQRTVSQYNGFVIGSVAEDNADPSLKYGLIWTAAFWGLGYVLLWTDPASGSLKAVEPHKTGIAKHVKRLQVLPARKSLIKPKDVKRKTPKKPKPVQSSAQLTDLGTMKATRPKTVKVETNGGQGLSPRQDASARISRVQVESDGTIKRIIPKATEPDTADSGGKGASKGSRDSAKAAPAKARGRRRKR